jgi:hypothetical protein
MLESGATGLVTIPIHYEADRPFTNITMEAMPQGTHLLGTGAAYTRIAASMLDALSPKPDVLFKSLNFNENGSDSGRNPSRRYEGGYRIRPIVALFILFPDFEELYSCSSESRF